MPGWPPMETGRDPESRPLGAAHGGSRVKSYAPLRSDRPGARLNALAHAGPLTNFERWHGSAGHLGGSYSCSIARRSSGECDSAFASAAKRGTMAARWLAPASLLTILAASMPAYAQQ